MNGYRIVFMGTPNFASYVLEGLLNASYNIVGVVSQPDKEIGRKKVLTSTPVKEVAIKNSIRIFTPINIREDFKDILDLKPDLIITCAYGQIIPKELLDFPKFKCVNIHGSLLPYGRGGAPIQRAILEGKDKTGITLMYMNEKMDEGDILYQKELVIDDLDTNSSLFDKLSHLALDMMIEFLPKLFKNDICPIKQDNSKATYTYNLSKEDEFISFDNKTIKVYNHIRALLDNPGCYFKVENNKYKILKAHYKLCDVKDINMIVGLEEDYLRINCLDGFIKVFLIKPEGKNDLDAKSFFNGQGRKLILKHPDKFYE